MAAEQSAVKQGSEEPQITIENFCAACGKGPCDSPCKKWNDFLEKKYLLPK